MDKKFYLKEAEIRAKEMMTKIDKAELNAEQKKAELDKYVNALKNKHNEYLTSLENLKNTDDNNWKAETEKFETKYGGDSVVDEITEVAKEITETTKGFLTNFGDKVSSFYHKNMEKLDNEEKKEK